MFASVPTLAVWALGAGWWSLAVGAAVWVGAWSVLACSTAQVIVTDDRGEQHEIPPATSSIGEQR